MTETELVMIKDIIIIIVMMNLLILLKIRRSRILDIIHKREILEGSYPARMRKLPHAHAQGVKQSVCISVVVVTPRACARGKVIGFVCRRRQHKNRQIWRSRRLSDL